MKGVEGVGDEITGGGAITSVRKGSGKESRDVRRGIGTVIWKVGGFSEAVRSPATDAALAVAGGVDESDLEASQRRCARQEVAV